MDNIYQAILHLLSSAYLQLKTSMLPEDIWLTNLDNRVSMLLYENPIDVIHGLKIT